MAEPAVDLIAAEGSVPKRKLAAILAADFAGYSRLMHADEERTLATLTAHREIVDLAIAAAHGTIASTAGDSVLAEFPSVLEAFRSAVAIQQSLTKANAPLPEDERLELRIAIHIGDVMSKDGDIFGDGVNIACRVEAMAEVGGICITRAVRDHLRDQVDNQFEDLGEQTVKNIARPVRVFKAIFDADAEPDLPLLVETPDAETAEKEPADSGGAIDDAVELAFWQTVQTSDDENAYQLYLEKFPEGTFAELAHTRLENGGSAVQRSAATEIEVAFWETVKDSGNSRMLQAYIEKYPDGEFKPLADIILAGLS